MTHSRTCCGSRRRGFSLIELLVVVAVLGLLLAILLPTFKHSRAIARASVCQANLHGLGQAYSARRSAEQATRMPTFPELSWQAALLPYVGQDEQTFICPEDDSPWFSVDGGTGVEGVFIEVFAGSLDNPGDFAWDMHLNEENEFCWRMSQTQFDSFSNDRDSYNHTGYTPDAEPQRCWYVFEDQGWKGGGDMDYYDIMLCVDTSGGNVNLTVRKGAAGYNFNLRRGEDRQLLMRDLKGNDGQSVEFSGYGVSTGQSYGMTAAAHAITPGTRKIILLDYERLVADVVGFDAADDWNEWMTPSGVPAFARHLGKCNVLYADGAVEARTPDEIHPDDPTLRQRYWEP